MQDNIYPERQIDENDIILLDELDEKRLFIRKYKLVMQPFPRYNQQWARIILDEAQMVKRDNGQMICLLRMERFDCAHFVSASPIMNTARNQPAARSSSATDDNGASRSRSPVELGLCPGSPRPSPPCSRPPPWTHARLPSLRLDTSFRSSATTTSSHQQMGPWILDIALASYLRKLSR